MSIPYPPYTLSWLHFQSISFRSLEFSFQLTCKKLLMIKFKYKSKFFLFVSLFHSNKKKTCLTTKLHCDYNTLVSWPLIWNYCKRNQYEVLFIIKKPNFELIRFLVRCTKKWSFLRIWSHLLKKSLMGNFIAVIKINIVLPENTSWENGVSSTLY